MLALLMCYETRYMKLISGEIIGDSNYIGRSLNWWIQKLLSKGLNPIQILQIFLLK